MRGKNPEQRINNKFCVKIGKSASETLALLIVAYGKYSTKNTSVFKWHRRFKEGRDVQDDPRSGQPVTQRTDANVDRVGTLVRSHRRLGVRVLAEKFNMNRETERQIVNEDLWMRKFSTKMVPRILTHDKKQRQLHISTDPRIPLQKWTIQPYSPDLAPCDFWLFPKLKSALKGRRFPDLSDIQRNVKTLFF